jgi:DNA mismatch repair protein MutL
VPPLAVRERPQGQERPVAEAQMALFMAGAPTAAAENETGYALRDPDAGRPRLWQVLDTYVIAETRDGLLIVDQHSAHERILFQRLMDAFQAGGQHGQRLLFPLTLRLSAPEVSCIADLRGMLARAGFEVEGFGGDTVIVHAVPDPHPRFDAERAFREMIHELTHGSELVRSARNQHERIAMTFACKSAIKAGQRLSESEMHQLFDQLFATDLPYHDVHGRPTVVRLSTSELARKFGRS